MDQINIDNLLQHITAINKKYENIEAITGEKFNVFKILKMETNEVKTHSAMIAELLNPRGSHGQKDVFLKAFIKQFEIKEFKNIVTTDIIVKVEELSEFGRIDIVVRDYNGNAIVIENKIYASDQPQQLVRYRERYNNCHLIYLTLFGTDPSEYSIKTTEGIQLLKSKEFYNRSYKVDVLSWLLECRKAASMHPMLRETLTQYINIIKILTKQTMNEQNESEIIDAILKNSDNVEAAEKVAENWVKAKFEIVNRLIKPIIKIGEDLNLRVVFDTWEDYPVLGNYDSGFWFFKDDWKYCIYFCFSAELDAMKIGVDLVNNTDTKDQDLIPILYKGFLPFAEGFNDENWLWYIEFHEWNNQYGWSEFQAEMPGIIKEKILQLVRCINSLLTTKEFNEKWIKILATTI